MDYEKNANGSNYWRNRVMMATKKSWDVGHKLTAFIPPVYSNTSTNNDSTRLSAYTSKSVGPSCTELPLYPNLATLDRELRMLGKYS